MVDSTSARLKNWLRRKLRSQDTTLLPHQTDTCANKSPVSERVSEVHTSESELQPQGSSPPRDLWKSAFDQLGQEERDALQTSHVPSSTTDALSNVIEATKEKYEEYQEKGGIRVRKSTGEEVNIRKVARRIIDATLSFKEVISAGVACDPTGHAASAWAIVSLGLTMAKNHSDRRDALFESSEYLAAALARCAFIEKKICHNRPEGSDVVAQAMIKLYKAILQYAAKIMASHNMSTGDKLLDSVTAKTAQYITELQCSIEKEEQMLFQLAQLQTFEQVEKTAETIRKQNEKTAENILAAIDDKLSKSLNALILRFGLPVADNAFWNSYHHEDLCLEDTRVQTRSQITQWADSAESEFVFWLNGGAGTGKSTIARTIAQSFEAKGQLGASFFFKRGESDRGNARRLIPTITKELIKQNKDLASRVLGAIEKDPQIAAKDVTEQFNKLLLEPLKSVVMYQSRTLVIVIDALDECEDDKEIGKILHFLPRLQESSNMRLKIFLTSRPELPLRRFFERESSHRGLVLEKVAEEAIKEDIVRFLEHRFAEIGAQASTGKDWPGDEVVKALATMCMPLFISAATICRFVEQPGEDPVERLADVLNDQRRYVTKMDKTYGPILDRTLRERDENDQEKQVTRFKRIVGVIILLSVPLTINALAEFVGISARTVEIHLDSFHSVLGIPDKPDLPYSCRYWVFHVTQSKPPVSDLETLLFLEEHFLHWLEAMSLIGVLSETIEMMVTLQKSIQYRSPWIHALPQVEKSWGANRQTLEGHSGSVYAVAFSPDGHTIVSGSGDSSIKLWNAATGEQLHTLQGHSGSVYAVAFSPDGHTIVSGSDDNTIKLWNAATGEQLHTLQGHSGSVYAVAFSPDGYTIVSGSDDDSIKLWNAATGEQLQTFQGHSDSVYAVAFSPDGYTIVSGSGDSTIKLWNAATGEQLQTLRGHSGSVYAVAFSPDGHTIVSGSGDSTIKLWNAATGEQLHTLRGYLDWVYAVAFSPDGYTIVSGSDDNTIKLWNAATGEQLQTLQGHSDWVHAVAFSPDGHTIVSGSDDNTIKLWNAATGEQLHTLQGHSRSVRTVAFSPDGHTIVSGSFDDTIKLWNAATGEQLHTLQGHSGSVYAVAFSPDGYTIVSGSGDNTIKLWNAATGEQLHTLDGCSGSTSGYT
ncbi:hypothetical protein ATERTT37_000641 [Aspergillus terreus]